MFAFEQAYILHRLSRNDEALKKCLELPQDDTKTKLLLAQINYKLSSYEKTSEQYLSLLKDTKGSDAQDMMTNLMACEANEPTLGSEIDQILI
jgi:hypothetical protein